MTDLQLLFAKPAHAGWMLIFTPPYCPKFQPIERVWGFTKNGVATEYRTNRTIPQLYTDLMVMWYGGTGAKSGKTQPGLTPALVLKFIKGSERDMDLWIKAYGRSVKGTVASLVEDLTDEWPNSDPEASESDGVESESESDESDG